MASVDIQGDRFGSDGRVKEEVTINFNAVEGTLFINCQGRKTTKSYSLPLREVRQLLLPLLAEGYVNLMIPPVGDDVVQRRSITGPCRPGMEHAAPCLPLENGECACGCTGDDYWCMSEPSVDPALARKWTKVVEEQRAPIIPPGPGRPGGPSRYQGLPIPPTA